MRSPSVTTVLSPWADFSMVREDVLKAACDRGTMVHNAMAAHALGLFVPKLPEGYQGYFDSGRRWFDRFVSEVILVEPELIDKDFGFCGHPDLICGLKSCTGYAIPDYKTAQTPSKTWAPQLAGYKRLAEKEGYHIHRLFNVILKPDGKMAKVVEYLNSPNDFKAFLSALNCWKYFIGE